MMRKHHARFGREEGCTSFFLPDVLGVAADPYLRAAYAASNNPQQVGRMRMRVLDRTKRVLDLIYAQPSAEDQAHSNPYLNGSHLGDQRHGT